MKKCFLCSNFANLTERNELFEGYCKECINVIEREIKNKPPGHYEIERSKIQKKILSSQKNVDDNLTNASNLLKKNHNASKEPVSTHKSSITFKGEVRPLNEKEQNSLLALECPYCKLKIDRKLYFYPLVIHNCGAACFHSKCFAKLMAEGEYKCLVCKHNFFTSSNESVVNHLSDDDDDDDNNYF